MAALIDHRRRLGLSQQALAIRARCSIATLVGIERYRMVPVHPGTRMRIAAALGVPEAELWPSPPRRSHRWRDSTA